LEIVWVCSGFDISEKPLGLRDIKLITKTSLGYTRFSLAGTLPHQSTEIALYTAG
jgi:hypothetical protein